MQFPAIILVFSLSVHMVASSKAPNTGTKKINLDLGPSTFEYPHHRNSYPDFLVTSAAWPVVIQVNVSINERGGVHLSPAQYLPCTNLSKLKLTYKDDATGEYKNQTVCWTAGDTENPKVFNFHFANLTRLTGSTATPEVRISTELAESEMENFHVIFSSQAISDDDIFRMATEKSHLEYEKVVIVSSATNQSLETDDDPPKPTMKLKSSKEVDSWEEFMRTSFPTLAITLTMFFVVTLPCCGLFYSVAVYDIPPETNSDSAPRPVAQNINAGLPGAAADIGSTDPDEPDDQGPSADTRGVSAALVGGNFEIVMFMSDGGRDQAAGSPPRVRLDFANQTISFPAREVRIRRPDAADSDIQSPYLPPPGSSHQPLGPSHQLLATNRQPLRPSQQLLGSNQQPLGSSDQAAEIDSGAFVLTSKQQSAGTCTNLKPFPPSSDQNKVENDSKDNTGLAKSVTPIDQPEPVSQLETGDKPMTNSEKTDGDEELKAPGNQYIEQSAEANVPTTKADLEEPEVEDLNLLQPPSSIHTTKDTEIKRFAAHDGTEI